ncbi:MAG: alpha/beta hydrolase-fold protein [Bacteroidota bacterium]
MKFLIISLVLSVLGFSFLYAQSTASKQISSMKFESAHLDSAKRVWIYTPKSYKSSEKRYPVIYMFDAQNLFDAKRSYAGEWEIDEYFDNLKNADKEVIVVGIEHGNEKRIEELTPYPHEKHGGGKGDDFMKFIVNDLKPKIDMKYRTLSDKTNTMLFGSSLGGLMSLYGTIKYPDVFSKAGVFSPAFWINPEIYDLVEASNGFENNTFYFMAGDSESEDMVTDMEKMIKLLHSEGLKSKQIKSKVVKGGQHNEQLWRENFPDAFEWLMN